ncbi:hypothetical protein PoB_005545900 [Plakobranchus ocellatus]|uniref:Uncharacterized protein n=1 Tax=Plakobranchus ocellatus TaxID=259542 RepID=A0AAV4C8R6_9GAST|nr:hypothetical protein PoB_005545900 [Plakobranchus ocellatus]
MAHTYFYETGADWFRFFFLRNGSPLAQIFSTLQTLVDARFCRTRQLNRLCLLPDDFESPTSPQLAGDLRLSGPPSGPGAGDWVRTRDRRVPADLRAHLLSTVPERASQPSDLQGPVCRVFEPRYRRSGLTKDLKA